MTENTDTEGATPRILDSAPAAPPSGGCPAVLVVIVNYNGGGFLVRAIDAMKGQTFGSFRLIVVDNASDDGSPETIIQKHPDVEIIHAGANLGFAAANNLAVRFAGDIQWVAFLNPDAFPEPTWLDQLMSAAQLRTKYSCFASKVVFDREPGTLDGAGDDYHISGFAWRRGHGRARSCEAIDREVFMVSATAALIRREAFEKAGGFDERYFCYYEDVDLGFRLRLLGYRSWYVSDALVRHVGSGITGQRSAFVTRHTQRNRIWTYVKNMPAPWIWMLLPIHVFYQLLVLVYYARQGQAGPAVGGALEALRGLSPILATRASVQGSRCTTWGELARTFRWGLLTPLFRR